MAVDIDLVLAAADNTEEAAEAAEYALAIAERYAADLHLLHVLDQRVMQDIDAGDVEAELIANQQQWITNRVKELLPDDSSVEFTQSGTAGYSSRRLDQTPGSVILDAAEELDADFIVIPRVTPRGSRDEVLAKSALYVLEYAKQPVLSV